MTNSLWWRSWHGAPTDSKWLAIAKKTGLPAGMISAVAWALFDYASQNSTRGCVEGFDIEGYSAFSGFDETHVTVALDAIEKKLVEDGKLVSWDKRQPKREDNSTNRVKAFRERNAVERSETQCNAILDNTILDNKVPAARPAVISLEFEKFKKVYPGRKGGQGWTDAKKHFDRAVKEGCAAADLILAAEKYKRTIQSAVGTEFVPMARTWLSKRDYRDFLPTPEDTAKEAKITEFMRSQGKVWVEGKGWIALEQG